MAASSRCRGTGTRRSPVHPPQQSDLNRAHPAVREEHEDVLRSWFERGVAGVRIDSAALPVKDPVLPDFVEGRDPHPYVDRDELHEIHRSWRRVADAYGGVLVGEVWLPDSERFARYPRPDELHTAFDFTFLACPWGAARLRTPTDLELGTRRVRAAALLTLALPGSVYLYQGEEPGLSEADVPRDRIQDPMHFRSGGTDPGRGGCRVPLPWTAYAPHAGFGSRVEPWLPQPAGWSAYAADRQAADPASMLTLHRTALRLRRTEPGFADGPSEWLPAPDGVLALHRAPGLLCLVDLAATPAVLPDHQAVLLTSGPLDPDGDRPPTPRPGCAPESVAGAVRRRALPPG